MLLALASAGVASSLCVTERRIPMGLRVLHLLPVPLMAVGTGQLAVPHEPLMGVVSAAGLWVLGIIFGRRAAAGQPRLWADSVDNFAMAVAMVVCVAQSVAFSGARDIIDVPRGHVHAHGAALLGPAAEAGMGGAGVWIAAVVLVVAVVGTRVIVCWGARNRGRERSAAGMWRDAAVAALMGGSTLAMLAG